MKPVSFFVAVLLLISLQGCIRDSLKNCDRGAYVHFSYVGDGTTEIFRDKIGQVDLYVFDKNNNIYVELLSQADLNREQGYKLDLQPGEYDVVCIGNAYQQTEILEVNRDLRLEGLRIAHPNFFETGAKVPTNDSLYYGHLSLVIPDQYRRVVDTVHFSSQHVKMYVEVAGVPAGATLSRNGTPNLELRINNLSSYVDFTNTTSSQVISYHPECGYCDRECCVTTRFNILRHGETDPVEIEVRGEDGEIYYTLNLPDFLASHPDADILLQEAYIPIRIVFEQNQVKVEVPGWERHEVVPNY